MITELFVKLNISYIIMSKSYFKVPKTIRLNSKHHLVMNISNKREL